MGQGGPGRGVGALLTFLHSTQLLKKDETILKKFKLYIKRYSLVSDLLFRLFSTSDLTNMQHSNL